MKVCFAGMLLMFLGACSSDDNDSVTPNTPDPEPDPTTEPTPTSTTFAKGADVSWVTEMEASGMKFYNASGEEMECMSLLQDLGMNAIRLRVWVDPTDGWCGKEDVVAKAVRANNLGMRLMIDFHYSDSWADPGKQIKPASWTDLSLTELKNAITSHTQEVLNALKDNGVTPEWVQVGNEVRSGMLWDTQEELSGATWDATYNGVTYCTNEKNFADFISTGYDAVKAVFPDAKVIVHIDEGSDNDTYQWIFGDILNRYSAKYDIIGMSLYPDSSWSTTVNLCLANIKDMISRYDKEVMICEVGMAQEPAETAKACLTELITQTKVIEGCLGVFYWEPECYDNWQGYNKGAFSNDGKPTVALDAFND